MESTVLCSGDGTIMWNCATREVFLFSRFQTVFHLFLVGFKTVETVLGPYADKTFVKICGGIERN